MPPAMTDDEVFDEVFVAVRRAFPLLPDLRVIERPGWLQIITPSVRSGGLNEVKHSALTGDDLDQVIDATIAGYRELGLRFRWNAGPGSAPAELGARLADRGLVASPGRGMARATTAPLGALDPAITVEPVTAASLAAYARVVATGWGFDHVATATTTLQIREAPGPAHRMFLARWRGEPAAAASYVALPRSAYLIGGVVLPDHRGRGLYRALVQARLTDAHAHGLALATSHAREATSAPILDGLGFATIARFAMYFG